MACVAAGPLAVVIVVVTEPPAGPCNVLCTWPVTTEGVVSAAAAVATIAPVSSVTGLRIVFRLPVEC